MVMETFTPCTRNTIRNRCYKELLRIKDMFSDLDKGILRPRKLVDMKALFEKMKKTYPDYAHPPRGQAMGYATELDSEVEGPLAHWHPSRQTDLEFRSPSQKELSSGNVAKASDNPFDSPEVRDTEEPKLKLAGRTKLAQRNPFEDPSASVLPKPRQSVGAQDAGLDRDDSKSSGIRSMTRKRKPNELASESSDEDDAITPLRSNVRRKLASAELFKLKAENQTLKARSRAKVESLKRANAELKARYELERASQAERVVQAQQSEILTQRRNEDLIRELDSLKAQRKFDGLTERASPFPPTVDRAKSSPYPQKSIASSKPGILRAASAPTGDTSPPPPPSSNVNPFDSSEEQSLSKLETHMEDGKSESEPPLNDNKSESEPPLKDNKSESEPLRRFELSNGFTSHDIGRSVAPPHAMAHRVRVTDHKDNFSRHSLQNGALYTELGGSSALPPTGASTNSPVKKKGFFRGIQRLFHRTSAANSNLQQDSVPMEDDE